MDQKILQKERHLICNNKPGLENFWTAIEILGQVYSAICNENRWPYTYQKK